jgi:hypothetical protein
MRNLQALGLLFIAALPASLYAGAKPCRPFVPSTDPKKWTWMDRNCRIRARRQLLRPSVRVAAAACRSAFRLRSWSPGSRGAKRYFRDPRFTENTGVMEGHWRTR